MPLGGNDWRGMFAYTALRFRSPRALVVRVHILSDCTLRAHVQFRFVLVWFGLFVCCCFWERALFFFVLGGEGGGGGVSKSMSECVREMKAPLQLQMLEQ